MRGFGDPLLSSIFHPSPRRLFPLRGTGQQPAFLVNHFAAFNLWTCSPIAALWNCHHPYFTGKETEVARVESVPQGQAQIVCCPWYLFIPVFLCVYTFLPMWMSIHMCVRVWKPKVAVGHQLQLLFHLFHERIPLSQMQSALIQPA